MTTDIWLIFSQARRPETSPARARIRTICKSRGWDFQERPARELSVTASGRKRLLISGEDADALYRRLHISRVGILCFERVEVSLDLTVQKGATRDRLLVSLRVFSLYKSFYSQISIEQPARWLEDFERWHGVVHCEGEHDPRCLPLHVFKAQQLNLDVPTQREEFARLYGDGSVRVDDESRLWKLSPHDFHGREPAQVAGWSLRPGFHWDVTPHAGYTRIVTTTQVWEVYKYANVYPNAHIRGRHPNARRVYPK